MSFLVGYLVFGWTEPTAAPPGGNVSAPINVGSTAQTKAANLTINPGELQAQLFRDIDLGGTWYVNPSGSSAFSGSVGIGIAGPSYKLDVQGGDINVSGVYRKGGTAGVSSTCPIGQTFSGLTVSGGIMTSTGSCLSPMTNPMTTPGDIIYGGAGGTPTRLAGAAGFLKSTGAAAPSWADAVTSVSGGTGLTASPNPITTTGTISLNTLGISACTNPTTNKIYWDSTNTRLGCGTDQTGITCSPSCSTNYVAKFTGASTIGNSLFYDNGTIVGIGTTTPDVTAKLDVEAGTGTTGVLAAGASTGVYGYGSDYGVRGEGNNGVYGHGNNGVYGSGTTNGVYGSGPTGVYGTGTTGVYGNGGTHGVYGEGTVYGVMGAGTSSPSYGVFGSGNPTGVYGEGPSYGVYGAGGNNGVYGTGTTGVYGEGSIIGVYARHVSGIALYVDGTTYTTGDMTVGRGTGKINAGTIDPIFDINGKKYATYMADFAGGTRVEASGTIQLTTDNLQPETVIDFDGLEKDSDLWLFWQASNKNINDVALLLTPGFEGKVWYEKNGNSIIIYGDRAGEVSFRLSAPRVDYQKWRNLANDQSLEGINISNY